MKWIGAPFRFLYKIYFGVIFIISGIVLYPYFFIALRGKNKFKNAVKVKKLWSDIICLCCFIFVKVEGKENFNSDNQYIICANHASYLDIILMYKIVPHDFAFLGKAEVLKWPLVNIFFKKGIDIPVFRSNRKKSAESLLNAKRALISGRSLAIFPEGKMQDSPPKMERFKNGAFSLALEHHVSIIPLTFQNNYKLFSDHTDVFGVGNPGISKILIHPKIEVTEETDLVSLRNQTYDIIKKGLNNED
jgi:1-acyl-sn-glycerol-3-phosphate acyltransferase